MRREHVLGVWHGLSCRERGGDKNRRVKTEKKKNNTKKKKRNQDLANEHRPAGHVNSVKEIECDS